MRGRERASERARDRESQRETETERVKRERERRRWPARPRLTGVACVCCAAALPRKMRVFSLVFRGRGGERPSPSAAVRRTGPHEAVRAGRADGWVCVCVCVLGGRSGAGGVGWGRPGGAGAGGGPARDGGQQRLSGGRRLRRPWPPPPPLPAIRTQSLGRLALQTAITFALYRARARPTHQARTYSLDALHSARPLSPTPAPGVRRRPSPLLLPRLRGTLSFNPAARRPGCRWAAFGGRLSSASRLSHHTPAARAAAALRRQWEFRRRAASAGGAFRHRNERFICFTPRQSPWVRVRARESVSFALFLGCLSPFFFPVSGVHGPRPAGSGPTGHRALQGFCGKPRLPPPMARTPPVGGDPKPRSVDAAALWPLSGWGRVPQGPTRLP